MAWEEVIIKRIRLSQIFFGWWTTLFGGILSGFGAGVFVRGASVFFLPVASELGLSRAGASVAGGIGSVCNGLMFPLAGFLTDKYGPKWVVTAGIFFLSGGLVLMTLVASSWSYYLIWGVFIGAGHGFGFTVAHDTVLTNWFVKKRGIALGSRFAVMGIMEVLALLMISPLVATQGWRTACLVCAGIILVIGLPVALFFVRERPEHYGLLPDGAKVDADPAADVDAMLSKGREYAAGFQETDFSLKQALKTPTYWIMTLALIVEYMILQGLNLHCIPFLIDNGIEPVVAAGLMAMMVFFAIPSRFFSGIMADRIKKEHVKYLLAGAILLPALGLTAFLLSQTLSMIYLFLILFGIGTGAYIPLDAIVRGRYFGRKAYGSLQGISKLFTVPMIFLSSIFVGLTHDITGNYLTVFTIFAALATGVALLLCMMRVPQATNPCP